jgi:hypothetical protein
MNEVGHIPCPKCHSRDNAYRWADGHEFCFGGCGYRKLATLTNEAKCVLLQERVDKEVQGTKQEKSQGGLVCYALDTNSNIKDPGLTWIKKYGIYNEEILNQDILWSESQQQLIFPIYDQCYDLIAWQARNFGPNTRKYVTFGPMNEIIHVLGLTKIKEPDTIIVEDIISAIKVSRHYRAMPLFGSSVSREKLIRLRRLTDTIKFWLDSDKLGTSMKLAKIASQLGFKTTVIYTENDPKTYSNEDIIEHGRT